MKEKIKILAAGFAVGAVFFVLFQFSGCLSATTDKEIKTVPTVSKVNDKEASSCCSSEMDEGEYTENSVYQLDSKWINQSNEKVSLSDFEGKDVVLTMFFAGCTYACPVLVNDMKRIEARLTAEEKKQTQFVLVSIDVRRDTPAVLHEFAEKYSLDLNKWTLLSGNETDIQDLAAVLGFKYKKDENEDYSHSNLINILNKKGEIIHQHTGLNQDVAAAAKILNENKNL
jgi:protein SCO1/2